MKDKDKIKHYEEFIKSNCILWLDGKGVFNKWDDQVNLIERQSKEFQKYIRGLLKDETY